MFRSLKREFNWNLLNVAGWRTSRKILVIESDDWGTVRMASRSAFNKLLKSGLPVDKCHYNLNDRLESNKDLELLFEVLDSVKNNWGKSAKITANNIVANPDFDKIRESKFEHFFFEPFTETFKRYPDTCYVEGLYQEGIRKNVVVPQFHGREHVNIDQWLKLLRTGNKALKQAFDHSMFTVHTSGQTLGVYELMNALDGESEKELTDKMEILIEGLALFKKIWGFSSKSFIAPCYVWHPKLENVLAEYGIEYIQGTANQRIPSDMTGGKYKSKFHYQGQRNKNGQHYLIRNAYFEPSYNPSFDWVSECLKRIQIAFSWKKPAVIGSHRVNFIGSIREKNRDNNLKLFKELLRKVVNKWPDIEFMSSNELGELMN